MSGNAFVGFGLGPIQSGLMLLEAQSSGTFHSYTIAEVDQTLLDAVRANNGRLAVNVAYRDRVQVRELQGLTVLNPRDPMEREALIDAIRSCDEMATAVPSVELYDAGGESSIAALLAAGVDGCRPQLIYACENNNYAAELLLERLRGRCDAQRLRRLQILNTVVGKMSGVIRGSAQIASLGLTPLAPGLDRAVLVEEFNRILVSKVCLQGYTRGITVFGEKEELLPFEEAKLFGHNAIHALLGYRAATRGLTLMSEIRAQADLLEQGRRAFIDECGAALIRKHARPGEALFTPAGWQAYAEDLLDRMTNPFLHDSVERICRDPGRKLGYGDRLFGAMRECLKQGVEARLLAAGAYAALQYLHAPHAPSGASLSSGHIRAKLVGLWQGEADDGLMRRCMALTAPAAPDV